jgi:hypothetical protein
MSLRTTEQFARMTSSFRCAKKLGSLTKQQATPSASTFVSTKDAQKSREPVSPCETYLGVAVVALSCIFGFVAHRFICNAKQLCGTDQPTIRASEIA